MRELSDFELAAVAGGIFGKLLLFPKNAPVVIGVPSSGPTHEQSPRLETVVPPGHVALGARHLS